MNRLTSHSRQQEDTVPDEFHCAVNRYLFWLGVTCLILLPSLGVGAIVIWGLTALTLRGLFLRIEPPPASRPKERGQRPQQTCPRKGSRR